MDRKKKPTAQPKEKVEEEKIEQEQVTEGTIDPWEELLFGNRRQTQPKTQDNESTKNEQRDEDDVPFSWI